MENIIDNIIFEKIWQDGDLIELKISGKSDFVSVYQYCYIDNYDLVEIAKKMYSFINNHNNEYYLEFGKKSCDYTPAFSMRILPANLTGHLKIETDFEIADTDTHLHKCCFYINSEIGLIRNLGKSLESLTYRTVGTVISLNGIGN